MVAKIKFWLLERSMSITKASLSVMILKSVLRYSLLTTRPCFTRKATQKFRCNQQGSFVHIEGLALPFDNETNILINRFISSALGKTHQLCNDM